MKIKDIIKLLNPITRWKFYKYSHKDVENGDLEILDKASWDKALKRFYLLNPRNEEIIENFYRSPINILKKRNFKKDKPILILIEKDDIIRLQIFLEYYRSLGIEQFVILDNDSKPEILEYLESQDDVFLLSNKIDYSSSRREAWINRIISYFGFERWYCVFDLDELCTYNNFEKYSIPELIKWASKNKIDRIRGFLLDMYPEIITSSGKLALDYSEYKYFDSDDYNVNSSRELIEIKGGFRKRVFNVDPLLTKYPIFYFQEGDIHGCSHFLFPYEKNFVSKNYIAIRHYKFLPQDFKNYKAIIKKGNYYNGSAQYKGYVEEIEKSESIAPKERSSVEFETSKDLLPIKIYDPVNWDNFKIISTE